jgi:hypothetical protein
MFQYNSYDKLFILLLLQTTTFITSVVFIKLSNLKDTHKFNISTYTVNVVLLLLVWILSALPVNINFLIKINIITNVVYGMSLVFTILIIYNTIISYIYINYYITQSYQRSELLTKTQIQVYKIKQALVYISIFVLYSLVVTNVLL